MIDSLSFNLILPSSIQLGNGVLHLAEAEEANPTDARRVRSVIEEHAPKLLRTNVDGSVLRIRRFVECGLGGDELGGGVTGSIF